MSEREISKVVIVGAGVAGRELLGELKKHLYKQYKVLGFIDDDRDKIGGLIDGMSVIGSIEDLGKLVKKFGIDGILIAIPSSEGVTVRRILDSCRGERLFFKIVPREHEIILEQAKVELHKLRDVRVEDLFGGAIVQKEQVVFSNEFKKRSILVTGAAGSIGSEICRQLIQFFPRNLVAFDWWENGLFELENEFRGSTKEVNFECAVGNIQDKKRVREVIKKVKPDFIFHAAAFKHVPLMQSHPLEAVRNNVFGTENVAKIAYEEGVEKFIYISTDKAADPKSVMGTTKLIGEHVVSSLNDLEGTRYSMVRFGNVLGSHGSVVPIFEKQIASGGPVTVTDTKMTRFMMTIPEAVQLVLHASVMGNGGEIFVLYMGEQVSIDSLARFMIQLSGYVPNEDIEIKYVGIRPGEKVVERIIHSEEYLESTENERIFKVSRHSPKIDLYDLAELRKSVDTSNLEQALVILEKFAPHIENNSGTVRNIPFSRASLRREEINAVSKVLRSGWLTMGQETIKFEEEFAKYVGAKFAVAVNSCTAAMFLSLKALGIKEGDEVVVPAFTFPATVSVVVHCGATPVFADVEANGFTMDQKSLDKVITSKTKAVIPVHYAGNRAEINTQLPIIEDSAHFIPKNGDNGNTFTRCYSFYVTKNMTTGEGGMITTSNEEVAEWLRKARLHGLSHDAWKRYEVNKFVPGEIKSKWTYEVEFPGWKFNTTDIASSLGRVQLGRLDGFEARRREVVQLYNKLLGLDNKGTHLYPVLIEDRNRFFEHMKENAVGCSFHFISLHKEPAFKAYSRGKLPVTEHISVRVATLPLDATITNEEVERVASLVKPFLSNAVSKSNGERKLLGKKKFNPAVVIHS